MTNSKAAIYRSQKRSVLTQSQRNRNVREGREVFNTAQEAYKCLCAKYHLEPDRLLLQSLRNDAYTLKLDTFGPEELRVHMKALYNRNIKEINISFGSIRVNRDLRHKLTRLGQQRAFAATSKGSAIAIKSVSFASYKFANLRCLQVRGIKIGKKEVVMLEKGIAKCYKLERIDLSGSRLGDAGIGVLAPTIGRSPAVYYMNFAQCKLTDGSKNHIIKLISLFGITNDETVWSQSLRCIGEAKCEGPRILLDLSKNHFGDKTIEAIEGALSSDHWLLGLNLCENTITDRGISIIVDRCLQVNDTLPIVSVKGPGIYSDIMPKKLECIALERMQYLDRFAHESKEKHFFLCELLLKWNVSKKLILGICEGSGRKTESTKTETPSDEKQKLESHELMHILVDRLKDSQSSLQQTRNQLSRVTEEKEKLQLEVHQLRDVKKSHTRAEDEKDVEFEARLIDQLELTLASLALQIEDMKAIKECSDVG
ncbi:unnamed protein product [Albugo candida]|uniref:Uncharacterized protein n=1 Tax=Albugo candida TaxID=65357 RepID=A0A024GGU1_9STRA|nr:unnamed protein product [Albugo candida]|eukprot:CCI45560.1 unnamed protein product [Albugo candida]